MLGCDRPDPHTRAGKAAWTESNESMHAWPATRNILPWSGLWAWKHVAPSASETGPKRWQRRRLQPDQEDHDQNRRFQQSTLQASCGRSAQELRRPCWHFTTAQPEPPPPRAEACHDGCQCRARCLAECEGLRLRRGCFQGLPQGGGRRKGMEREPAGLHGLASSERDSRGRKPRRSPGSFHARA